MIPDPVLDKLARFTPNTTIVDNAALLFAAGRASARTPWFWKVATTALLLGNAGWLSLLIIRPSSPTAPVVVPQKESVAPVPPQAEPATDPTNITPPPSDDPWSYRALLSAGDPEKFPRTEVFNGSLPNNEPLTPRSSLRGDLD